MKELRAIYQGRSGRYTAADTQKMERLKTERSRARRFLPSGVADPDIVSGKRDANPAESIAQNADHHGAIPLLPRGKGTATGVSIGRLESQESRSRSGRSAHRRNGDGTQHNVKL